MSTGHFRKFADQGAPKIDDINLNIRFPDELSNVAAAVSAVIVLTVRNQKERLFGILARFGLG